MTEFRCQACGHEANLEWVASFEAEHRLSFKLSPHPGALLQAKTIGGTLSALAGLMKSATKPFGIVSEVLVEGVEVVDGAVTFHLLVTNNPTRPESPRT